MSAIFGPAPTVRSAETLASATNGRSASAVVAPENQKQRLFDLDQPLPHRYRSFAAFVAAAFCTRGMAADEFGKAAANAVLVAKQQFLVRDEFVMEEIGGDQRAGVFQRRLLLDHAVFKPGLG